VHIVQTLCTDNVLVRVQDLRKAADLTADRTGKADCQLEAGMILQKQKDYRAATTAMEVRH
jgi:hypothetical protein